jgi:hypothetical protein
MAKFRKLVVLLGENLENNEIQGNFLRGINLLKTKEICE